MSSQNIDTDRRSASGNSPASSGEVEAAASSIPESETARPGEYFAHSSGVNICGYLTAESGVGQAARGYARALASLSIPVAANNIELGVNSRKAAQTNLPLARDNPFAINLVCVNADQVEAVRGHMGEEYFLGKYNIGVWWWELPEFPERWWRCFEYFDELWVGSSYIQQSIAASSPIPVVLVPPVVVVDRADRLTRAELGIDSDEFVFLCMFDFFSSYERKNPLAVVRAFKATFKQEEPVRLILKFINSDSPEAKKRKTQLERECGAAGGGASSCRITFIDRYLSSGENQDLIALSDAYVSLHRSEGLGLPLAEAMSHRKPVIATAWSGNMDFTTVANSYLVSYELGANQHQDGPYQVADLWAEPDVEQAGALMRQVFEDASERVKRADRAALDISRKYSVESVAGIMQSRLKVIEAFNRRSSDTASQRNEEEATERHAERAITYQIDELTEKRLKMIERNEAPGSGSSSGGAAEGSKSLMRRVMLPLIEKSGYLNAIYAKLFRKLFVDTARVKTQVELIDARTRRMLADADARIAELERTIKALRESLSQSEKSE